MSVLDNLWNGNIYPAEDFVPKTAEYELLQHKLSDASEALESVLTEEQKALLEVYLNLRTDEVSMTEREIFRRSFVLGLQLQKETVEIDRLLDKE